MSSDLIIYLQPSILSSEPYIHLRLHPQEWELHDWAGCAACCGSGQQLCSGEYFDCGRYENEQDAATLIPACHD